jgi:hypothetical protein
MSLPRAASRSLLLAMIVVSGCSGDATGVREGCLGNFSLNRVNDSSPPALVSESAGTTVTLLTGLLTIQANGDFEEVLQFRVTPSAGAELTVVRTVGKVEFPAANSLARTVTFSPSSGKEYTGTASGAITYTKESGWGPVTLVFAQNRVFNQGPGGTTSVTGGPNCF